MATKLFITLFSVLIGFAYGQDAGSCSARQECISIKKCAYTKELFSRIKSTSDSEEKAELIQAIRLRVCGEPSDRTVCCDIEQQPGVFGGDSLNNPSLSYPKKIGDISKLTFHPLSGELWALDENTLEFRKFVYDGEGPDAFFILGTQTARADPNLQDAIPLPYFNQGAVPIQRRYSINDPSVPVLPEFRNQDIKLQLPPGVKVSDLQWLSLYCRDYDIDFGHVMF